MGPLIGSGIFTQDGPAWASSRALLRPSFDRKQASNLPALECHVDRLVRRLKSMPREPDGAIVLNAEPVLSMLTLDATTELLFGESTGCLKDEDFPEQEAFSRAWSLAQELMVVRAGSGIFHRVATPRRFWGACDTVHRFAERVIDQGIKRYKQHQPQKRDVQDTGSYVFLDALIEQTQDRSELRSQILNMLLAGRETSSAVIAWTLYMIRQDERVRVKLRNEIEHRFGLGPASRCPT